MGRMNKITNPKFETNPNDKKLQVPKQVGEVSDAGRKSIGGRGVGLRFQIWCFGFRGFGFWILS